MIHGLINRIAYRLPLPTRRRVLRLRSAVCTKYKRWLKFHHASQAPVSTTTPAPVSLLTLVFNPDPLHFDQCIEGVLSQTHTNFEWILLDNGEQNPAIEKRLQLLEERPGIKVLRPEKPLGITLGTKYAAEHASHDWIAFLDHDDLLERGALERMSQYFVDSIDLVYSDHDHCDDIGFQFSPVRKPGPSPELLLAYNYVTHFHAARKDRFLSLQQSSASDGSQDWDTTLRLFESPQRVAHVSEILYSHRQHPKQFSATLYRKSSDKRVELSQKKVLEDYLRRKSLGHSFYIAPTAKQGIYQIEPRIEFHSLAEEVQSKPPKTPFEFAAQVQWDFNKPYFAWLDPRYVCRTDWLNDMVSILVREPNVALVSGVFEERGKSKIGPRHETGNLDARWWVGRRDAFRQALELEPHLNTADDYCRALQKLNYRLVISPSQRAHLDFSIKRKLLGELGPVKSFAKTIPSPS